MKPSVSSFVPAPSPAPALFAAAGFLLLFRETVFYVGFYILGSSIEWPQSPGLGAEETFRLITAHPGAVFSGYTVYLLSGVLFLPIALALRALPRDADPLNKLALDVAFAFAGLSVAFRAMGILRWLFAMPALAQNHLATDASPALREAAVLQFQVLEA